MIPLLLPAVAATSAYATFLSVNSIRNVLNYEDQTKKAAGYSNTIADQLHTTRTTEAAGALAATLSLTTSVVFTIYPAHPQWLHLALAVFNSGAMWFASDHIGRFWGNKTRVPLPKAGKYNDAIALMESLRRVLGVLALGWVVDAGWMGSKLLVG